MKLIPFTSLFIFVSLAWGMPHASEAGNYVVVANQKVKSDSISKSDLKDIFLGNQNYWDSSKERIRVARLDDELEVTQEFVTEVVGTSVSQYLQHWRRKLFSGKGIPPKKFGSDKDVISYVESNEGAIGYVHKDSIKDANIKTLTIN